MGCENRHDICIIRGDSFGLVVGLAAGFPDVIANPADYEGRLVIRERQSDLASDLLVSTAVPEAMVDSRFPDMTMGLTFAFEPSQTQQLPPYDVVCFCEIVGINSDEVQRLWQGKVEVSD